MNLSDKMVGASLLLFQKNDSYKLTQRMNYPGLATIHTLTIDSQVYF